MLFGNSFEREGAVDHCGRVSKVKDKPALLEYFKYENELTH